MLPSPARTRTWHAQKQCRLRQGRAGDDEGVGEKGEVGRGGGVEGGERGGVEGGRARRERRAAGHVCSPSLACTLSSLPSSLSCYLPGASDPHPPGLRASHTLGYFGLGSTREIARPLVRNRSGELTDKKKMK